MSGFSKFRFLPVVSLNSDGFDISDEDARKIVSAHLEATLNHSLPNIRASSLKGMLPYMAAVALAFADLGFEDLLSESNRTFSSDDIDVLEKHFPFLICVTEHMARSAQEVSENGTN